MTRKPSRLSHVDPRGRVRMVDVGAKAETAREATAAAEIRVSRAALSAFQYSGCAYVLRRRFGEYFDVLEPLQLVWLGAVGLLLRSAERATAYLLGGVLLAGLGLIGGYLLSVRFRSMRSDEAAKVPRYRTLVTMNERFPLLPFLLDGVLVGLAYYGAYLVR